MADYSGYQFPEAHSVRLEPSFLRNSDTPYPTSPGFRRTHASSPSWISNFPPYSRPSSARPAHPSPPPTTRVVPDSQHPKTILRLVDARDTEEQPEPEHVPDMDVIPDWDTDRLEEMNVAASGESEQVDHVQPVWSRDPDPDELDFEPSKHKGKARTFVGGFVKRIRRLPTAFSKGRKLARKGDLGLGLTDTLDATTPLPRYDDPGQPIPGPSSNVQYVEGMDMPIAHPSQHLQEQQSYTYEAHSGYAEHPSAQLSYVEEGTPEDMEAPDDDLGAPFDNPYDRAQPTVEHEEATPMPVQQAPLSPPPPILLPPAPALLPPASVDSPVQVYPLPAADYARMESPVRSPPPDDSLGAHFTRAQRFMLDLSNLPWLAHNVSVAYYPAESSRARTPKQKPTSWYTTRQHQEVDLIGTMSPEKTPIRHRQAARGDDGGRMRLVMHSPTTYPTTTRVPSWLSRRVEDSSPVLRAPTPGAHTYPFHSPAAVHMYPTPESRAGKKVGQTSADMRRTLPTLNVGSPLPQVVRAPLSPETPTHVPYSAVSPKINMEDISLPRL